VARLLLAPIAFLLVLAGVLPLVAGVAPGAHAIAAGLADPALLPVLRQALLAALVAVAIAVPLGLLAALAMASAPRWARGLLYTLAVLLLVLPAPGFAFPDGIAAARLPALAAFGGAVARGAALALLILAPAMGRLPPGLRRAASMAGARPLQSWRHAVLLPLFWPIAAAKLACFIAALMAGPAAAVLAPHVDMARAWVVPAALLLAVGSLTALSTVLRPRAA
jgi:thiamine transport system permease protein